MTGKKTATPRLLFKLATGLRGFDTISRGGLPRNRTSLIMGGPGTGKTVFALQTLVSAARERRERGIFVAFEEGTSDVFANAAPFGWGLPALAKSALFFLDARLSPTIVQSGDFELSGMLAILEAKKQELAAQWIVFDGIDVLLALLQDPGAEVREIYRLRDWLAHNDLTAIITAKTDGESFSPANYGFMQFMADCVIRFDRRLEQGASVRRLEITKYRGSDFSSGEFPVSFGPHGMEVVAPGRADALHAASAERVSSGFADLDSMLGGGVFRGTTTLLTGAPGTSKTTLAGKFAESACRRGERTLFVSFDEGGERIRRNLTSVGIHLDAHVKSGLLRMYTGRTDATNPEEHLGGITALLLEHRPRCIVIDPLSAIAKIGALSSARATGNRLIYQVRDLNITAFITSLVEGDDPQAEATEMQISTIAYLDPSLVSGPGRRTQSRDHNRQVARHATLEPGARARTDRSRAEADGGLLLGRRSADGHVALGKGGQRESPKTAAAGGIRAEAQRAAVCRSGDHCPDSGPATRPREAAG